MAQRGAPQTLRRLTVIVAIQWMGATLGLPLLPLFLEHRDGTPPIVGMSWPSFFVAGVATQYAFGHLADRVGRRRVLVLSLVAYGLASMTYLLPVSAPWLALTRAVQGASAGAIEVASLSAVAALFAEELRGRAISRILAAQLFGIAIGPLVGVVASVNDLGWAFFVTGLVSLGAAAVAARTDLGDREHERHSAARTAVEPPDHRLALRGELGGTLHRRLRGVLEPPDARPPRQHAPDPAELDRLRPAVGGVVATRRLARGPREPTGSSRWRDS